MTDSPRPRDTPADLPGPPDLPELTGLPDLAGLSDRWRETLLAARAGRPAPTPSRTPRTSSPGGPNRSGGTTPPPI